MNCITVCDVFKIVYSGRCLYQSKLAKLPCTSKQWNLSLRNGPMQIQRLYWSSNKKEKLQDVQCYEKLSSPWSFSTFSYKPLVVQLCFLSKRYSRQTQWYVRSEIKFTRIYRKCRKITLTMLAMCKCGHSFCFADFNTSAIIMEHKISLVFKPYLHTQVNSTMRKGIKVDNCKYFATLLLLYKVATLAPQTICQMTAGNWLFIIVK